MPLLWVESLCLTAIAPGTVDTKTLDTDMGTEMECICQIKHLEMLQMSKKVVNQ